MRGWIVVHEEGVGLLLMGVVVAVAFPGPYGPETGYDPKDNCK